jgi:hypothetical protein
MACGSRVGGSAGAAFAALLALLPFSAAGTSGEYKPAGILIRPGIALADRHLGFGWSGREQRRRPQYRWITRLEADVWFDLQQAVDHELWVNAAPMYLDWQRQVVGVYVNGRFVAEWTCPDDPGFHDYRCDLPAAHLRTGRNRVTLRLAYRHRIPGDARSFALAVRRILIGPR